MGRRKTKAPMPKRPAAKLPRKFDCPFCEAVGSCTTSLERDTSKRTRGIIECINCHANWNMIASRLTAPIDIYYGWLDASEEQSKASVSAVPDFHPENVLKGGKVQAPAPPAGSDESDVDAIEPPPPGETDESEGEDTYSSAED